VDGGGKHHFSDRAVQHDPFGKFDPFARVDSNDFIQKSQGLVHGRLKASNRSAAVAQGKVFCDTARKMCYSCGSVSQGESFCNRGSPSGNGGGGVGKCYRLSD
jgi:hypothetical protein